MVSRPALCLALAAGAVAGVALAQSVSPSTPGGSGGTGLPGNVLTGYMGTADLDFGSISPGTVSSAETVAVAGASVGSAVHCNASGDMGPLIVASQWVSAAGEVSLSIGNIDTFSTIDPSPVTFYCVVTE